MTLICWSVHNKLKRLKRVCGGREGKKAWISWLDLNVSLSTHILTIQTQEPIGLGDKLGVQINIIESYFTASTKNREKMPLKINNPAKHFFILREASFIFRGTVGFYVFFCFLFFGSKKFFDGPLKKWKVSSFFPCYEINIYTSLYS